MGKEEDSLLLFLSMEKGDLETCCEAKLEEQLEQIVVGEEEKAVVSSRPVFWTCVATSLLILSLISGVFQFCPPKYPRVVVLRKIVVPFYEVPLREVPLDFSGVTDGTEDAIELVSIRGKFPEEPVLQDFYQGEAIVHEGRAYLTSQHSTDDKGVVAKSHSVGRLIHSQVLQMKHRMKARGHETVSSFHVTFVFSIENSLGGREATGDGFAFVMIPDGSHMGSAGGNLGVMDSSRTHHPHHTFAVEFDTWKNPSLHDISNNHVGVNVNSMVSLVAKDAGYWSMNGIDEEFQPLDLTSGKIQAWIDYDGIYKELTVSISPTLGWKPLKPLIKRNLDLSRVFDKFMSVGFSAATGDFAAKHIIHSWKFEESRSRQHWQSENSVHRGPVPRQPVDYETAGSSQFWKAVGLQRDHVSRLPTFRNPHKGDVTKRNIDLTVTALPAMASERKPMTGMRKNAAGTACGISCSGYLPDFPTMDFHTFKENVLHNSLWVLLAAASVLLFIHLVSITYHILAGCYDAFHDQSEESQEKEYCRVFEEYQKTSQAGYVLVLSEERHQQPSENRPLDRV